RIQFLYEHGDIAHEMGLAARENVCENYTWQDYANRINHVYRTIFSGSTDKFLSDHQGAVVL
ncbi:unnamed protein product, partial [marine sediment metagenome]